MSSSSSSSFPKRKEEKEKTFQFQNELPSLPVPELAHTLKKYQKAVQPFLTQKEFQHTQAVIQEFGKSNGVGEQLQKVLEERAAHSKNWLEEWWEYVAYTSYREPIAPNINMFTGFGSFAEFTMPVPQARRAAEMIRYTCEYKELLMKEQIPPERMSGRPMCMNLYTRIFSACRVPGDPADTFKRFDPRGVEHILVICRECCFFLRVYDEAHQLLTIGDIEIQLQRILKHAAYLASMASTTSTSSTSSTLHTSTTSTTSILDVDHDVVAAGVGALTSAHRAIWHEAHRELCQVHLSNGSNLKKIHSALFAVCLDDTAPATPAALVTQLAGGPCGNRWYDKSLQYVVYRNGMIGANMEHGNADATVFMSMFRWLGERYLQRAGGQDTWIESRQTDVYLPPAEVVHWCVTDSIRKAIALAKTSFEAPSDDLWPLPLRFKDYGRHWIKQQGFPPDSFLQMALQLAYFSIYQKVCPTYESAHTRCFYHGRTETIRSCTMESMAFVQTMRLDSASKESKLATLQAAIEAHTRLGMDALNGQGADRHLLGLQIVASMSGMKLPELYTDPAYVKSGGNGNFVLSTSNVSGYQWLWGGFAPMTLNGIGVCYDLDKEFIGLMISTYKRCKETDTRVFADTLFQCLRELRQLVEGTQKAKL